MELRVDELDALLPVPDAGTSSADNSVDYPDLSAWIRDFFAPTFARAVGGEARWCARWDEHPEAVYRLQALWRTWETSRRDARTGTGTALWLRDHLDPQLAVLLSPRGPFAQCTPTRHEALPPLPSAPNEH
ncbi:DUF4913 domain-containing protein [Kineococcus indalonis]|uniref:DUF4913 domain-containing protein n=1 Tax=Kineococcus indalonis TaxID=2696566 RepID=UPI00196A65D6|nr:DUF4913 domain-containing protein [Kineococcus indalonis]